MANSSTKLITAKLNKLGKEERVAFFKLDNSVPAHLLPPIQGVLKTNSFGLGDPKEGSEHLSGVFLTAYRFNHSCAANADYIWNKKSSCMDIRAVKAIAKKEEITISCIGDVMDTPRANRIANMLVNYHFHCRCDACSLPEPALSTDDMQRMRMHDIYKELCGGYLISLNPGRFLKYCREILQLGTLYSRGRYIADSYYDAFQACMAHYDLARASAFMKLNNDTKLVYEGPDSVTQKDRLLVRNPALHPSYQRGSKMWRTRVQDAKKAGEARFEEWLWARAEK